MPNFHLHWWVTWNALDQIGGLALDGRKIYQQAGRDFGEHLREELKNFNTDPKYTVDAYFEAIKKHRAKWFSDVTTGNNGARDKVTCFAACMLGACGPDFWTLPTESYTGTIPDTAGNYFDLGHYNRTHQQFRVSVASIGNAPGIQNDLERAYFTGMATHIAADLVLHQLVNVSAGSYPLLLTSVWNNEHDLPVKDVWKLHNKVEHYWDSYVRYRFLSDYTLPQADGSKKNVLDPELDWPDVKEAIGFPVVESLVERAKALIKDDARRNELLFRLMFWNKNRYAGKEKKKGGNEPTDDARLEIELPLIFPMLMCDRVVGGKDVNGNQQRRDLNPFIYDRVVHGRNGAYPSDLVYQDAQNEKVSAQMQDGSGRSERIKLTYFTTEKNAARKKQGKKEKFGEPIINWARINYVNYRVCPDLERLRETRDGRTYGRNAFYDLTALNKFGGAAVQAARTFGKAALDAYTSNALGKLATFWNLDTGIGFEVQRLPSYLDQEIVTRLDFPHIFSARIAGANVDPGYRRSDDASKEEYTSNKKAHSKGESKTTEVANNKPAFPVRDPVKFKTVSEIQEPDQDKYLPRVVVGDTASDRVVELSPSFKPSGSFNHREEQLSGAWLDAFFALPAAPKSPPQPAPTKSTDGPKTAAMQPMKHRLVLEMRIPIASLGGETAMFLHADDADWAAQSTETHDWISSSKMPDSSKLIAFSKAPQQVDGSLHVFTARIMVNMEEKPEKDRAIAAGKWNNVIPYNSTKRFLGRNFAIGTGRHLVLYPEQDNWIATNLFAPTTDLTYHPNFFPTEQIFMTVYALIRTPEKVYDAFSKQEVTRTDFEVIVDPESGASTPKLHAISEKEWKKVVLFYQLAGTAAQLDRCFIDGLLVKVGPPSPVLPGAGSF